MNIYTDFFSIEELQFITGRKQKERIKLQLNAMGIPFTQNAHGFPVVRRDYAQGKIAKKSQPANETVWQSNVLRTA